jgi:hypothetical protein
LFQLELILHGKIWVFNHRRRMRMKNQKSGPLCILDQQGDRTGIVPTGTWPAWHPLNGPRILSFALDIKAWASESMHFSGVIKIHGVLSYSSVESPVALKSPW